MTAPKKDNTIVYVWGSVELVASEKPREPTEMSAQNDAIIPAGQTHNGFSILSLGLEEFCIYAGNDS